MYKVGLTGGIGSGKSLVCSMLRDRGVAIYDCDQRAKELMASDGVIREELIRSFRYEVFIGGVLNRS
jgi:dephospho-CoA kinase